MKHDDHLASGIKLASAGCDMDINAVQLMFHVSALLSSVIGLDLFISAFGDFCRRLEASFKISAQIIKIF